MLKTMQLPRFRPREDELGNYLLVLTDGRNAVFLSPPPSPAPPGGGVTRGELGRGVPQNLSLCLNKNRSFRYSDLN